MHECGASWGPSTQEPEAGGCLAVGLPGLPSESKPENTNRSDKVAHANSSCSQHWGGSRGSLCEFKMSRRFRVKACHKIKKAASRPRPRQVLADEALPSWPLSPHFPLRSSGTLSAPDTSHHSVSLPGHCLEGTDILLTLFLPPFSIC